MPPSRLSVSQIGAALKEALANGVIREEDTAVIFYDLDVLEARVRSLSDAFPPGTLHALAIKANPLGRILEMTREISPHIGVEAASIGEVRLALHCGYDPSRVVFDSPVKTRAELQFALSHGIRLNIDNLAELQRVAEIAGAMKILPESIGIRINPQVGIGTIAGSSVAGEYSKFGIPVRHRRGEIEKAFLSFPWLNGVHLHVGSQGCHPGMLTDGIGILYDLVTDLNRKRETAGMPRIRFFDTGGGLPIAYRTGDRVTQMDEYAAMIMARAPELFMPEKYTLITEFGRWVFTHAGWTATRVEYVKHDRSINTAMIHAGADLFVRECLNPRDWTHEYCVFDSFGNPGEGTDTTPWTLAGPLCFSGDILARDLALPPLQEGDYIVVRDTGGYTFSMWSRYNSRQTPRIAGYRQGKFSILKEREDPDSLTGFWW